MGFFILKVISSFIFCMSCFACIMCVQCPWRPDEGIRSPATGVIDGLWDTMWVLGTKPQIPVLLATEPSFYPQRWVLYDIFIHVHHCTLLILNPIPTGTPLPPVCLCPSPKYLPPPTFFFHVLQLDRWHISHYQYQSSRPSIKVFDFFWVDFCVS